MNQYLIDIAKNIGAEVQEEPGFQPRIIFVPEELLHFTVAIFTVAAKVCENVNAEDKADPHMYGLPAFTCQILLQKIAKELTK